MKYDYFIGGRWRNHKAIREVLDGIRETGKTAYCFIDNSYLTDGIRIDIDKTEKVEEFMHELETLDDWLTNPTFRKIYENDMNGIRDSKETIIVFPAGPSAHMELGAAYGMGKKCYGIGKPDKKETLYLMMEAIYPDINAFLRAKHGAPV